MDLSSLNLRLRWELSKRTFDVVKASEKQIILKPSKLEMERAWAWAQRPGPNFGLTVNKHLAQGSTSLIFRKARSRLELRFHLFYKQKARGWSSRIQGHLNRLALVRAWYSKLELVLGSKDSARSTSRANFGNQNKLSRHQSGRFISKELLMNWSERKEMAKIQIGWKLKLEEKNPNLWNSCCLSSPQSSILFF